jgi:hypothetical protein
MTAVKFFILNVLLLALLLAGTFYIVSSASFGIPKEKNIIVIGDSHTECAIDDSIFLRSFNISQAGEAYLYSYIKLKKFLDVNPHIDTVFVSFHGGSIQMSQDEKIFGDNYILGHVPTYISLFGREELAVFLQKSSFYSAVIKTPLRPIRAVLRFVLNHPVTFKDLPIGGYNKLDRDRLQRAIELKEDSIADGSSGVENKYSKYQLEYLLKIVEVCKEKKVELILFNAPTYNSTRYGNLASLKNYYTTHFPGIKYLDYSDFPLPDYGYGDTDHLNFKGAGIFSRWLESNWTCSTTYFTEPCRVRVVEQVYYANNEPPCPEG